MRRAIVPGKITRRQLDVVKLIATGATNKEIARELELELKTVEEHIYQIKLNMGHKNRTQIAVWAVRNGIA